MMQLILTLTLTPKPILTKSNLNNNVHVPTKVCNFAMEFDSNKEILDNVGVDNEAQKSGRQKRKPAWLADYETY
jgi:hypothetical protein